MHVAAFTIKCPTFTNVRCTFDRFIFGGDGFISNRLMVSRDGCYRSLILTIALQKLSCWSSTHSCSLSRSFALPFYSSPYIRWIYIFWQQINFQYKILYVIWNVPVCTKVNILLNIIACADYFEFEFELTTKRRDVIFSSYIIGHEFCKSMHKRAHARTKISFWFQNLCE